ncbi:hypothetical protein JFL43_01730 [Viridibacillus sp. YIM B01967]|uniref:Lipoprotein n=1 Tax=Viridibacillus soli TaxID=2798301 RepID=A0ABS1H2I5_9BACL|nr:hypothetical protein [Viridibacillus soli]MBK3493609.1 hypothetical protein [Viridibacillus soli]
MKKIIMMLTLLFLVACSNNEGETLNFQGESENWKVNFTSVDTGSSSQNTSYTIVYIGSDTAPETFDYNLSATPSQKDFGETNAKLNKDGLKEGKEINKGSKVQKDEIIVVELNWDGKTEKVELAPK